MTILGERFLRLADFSPSFLKRAFFSNADAQDYSAAVLGKNVGGLTDDRTIKICLLRFLNYLQPSSCLGGFFLDS